MVVSALRAYVVDDEPLALRALVRLLLATGRVEVVGTATDPEAALEALRSTPASVMSATSSRRWICPSGWRTGEQVR